MKEFGGCMMTLGLLIIFSFLGYLIYLSVGIVPIIIYIGFLLVFCGMIIISFKS